MDSPRTIEPGTLYQIEEAKARLGIQRAAWRALLRGGLPVIRFGRRGYVKGSDVIEFLERFKQQS